MEFRANRRVRQVLANLGLSLAVMAGGATTLTAQDFPAPLAGVADPTFNAPSSGGIEQTGFFRSFFDNCNDTAAAATDACNPSGCCTGWCNLGEPLKLSKAKGFDYAGWLQMGWQSHADGAFTSPAEANKFNVNQLYLYSQKVADSSDDGHDWGYRFDTYYGVDGNEGQSFGNNPGNWDFLNGFDHGIYEIALPQAYLEFAYCDLSVKVGHFYTPIGYEVVTSPDQFFYSRQLTFYNSEPFTHTGALGTYKVNDCLSLTGGWTLGWDTGFDQFNGGSMGIGGFVYKLNEETTITNMAGIGNFGWRGQGFINSIIVSRQWNEKLQTVSQFDVLSTDLGTDFAATGIADNSTGWINYGFYSINDCLKLGMRNEWYKADGTSYYTTTGGVNLKPHANLVVRPEIRYNNSPGNPSPVFNKVIYGVDFIAKF